MLYHSRHWSTSEWDYNRREQNSYATTYNGRLATDNERTAELFYLLDALREKNQDWQVVTNAEGYKMGMTPNGGYYYHSIGAAADLWIAGETMTGTKLATLAYMTATAAGMHSSGLMFEPHAGFVRICVL